MRACAFLLERRAFPLFLTALLALTVLSDCGTEKKNPVSTDGGGTTPTTYTTLHGIFAGASDGGRLSLSIATGSLARSLGGDMTVPVTGTIAPTGGTAVALAGTYNPATDTLLVGATGYALLGVYEPIDPFPSISGTYHSPAGFGTFGCAAGESSAVKIFICTFAESNQQITGRFNLAAVDTIIAGVAFPDGGTEDDYHFFKGTVERTGYPRAIVLHGDNGQNVFDAIGEWNPNTDEAGGTWTVTDTSVPETYSGTWSGLGQP